MSHRERRGEKKKQNGKAVAFIWKDINFVGNMAWEREESIHKKSSIKLVSVSFIFNAVNHENALPLAANTQWILRSRSVFLLYALFVRIFFLLRFPIIFYHINAAFDYAKLNIKYVNYSWIILYKSNIWTFVRSIAYSGYGSISKLNHHSNAIELYWLEFFFSRFFLLLLFFFVALLSVVLHTKISGLNVRLMYVCAINLRELDLMWYF